jgi:uncharacterized protein
MPYNEHPMTLFETTVPVFTKALGGLKTVIEKAIAHGLSDDFLDARLAPDMFPFVKQVQIACDNAKGAVARLSGTEAPVFADDETTLAALIARIDATMAYVSTFTPAQFMGAEDRQITLSYFPGKYMTGFEYVQTYAIPNFFFHVTIAYALVRQAGVAIGKADYTNGLPFKDVA